MTAEQRLEKASAAVHSAWAKQKRSMGFHAPDECQGEDGVTHDEFVSCNYCHADLIPYEKLSEEKKELDRVTVRAVAEIYEEEIEQLEAAYNNVISEMSG